MTALHITVGEQAPKSFAIGSAERVAGMCAVSARGVLRLAAAARARPQRGVERAGAAVRRHPGHEPRRPGEPRGAAPADRRRVEAGKIDRGDAQLLRGVFTLDERRASDVMTPRHRAHDRGHGADHRGGAAPTIRSRHSRFPLARRGRGPARARLQPRDDRRAAGGRGEAADRVHSPRDRRRARDAAAGRAARPPAGAARDHVPPWSTSTASSRASSRWRTSSRRSSARSGTRTTAPRGIRRLADGGIVVRGDTPLVDLEDEGVHLASEHSRVGRRHRPGAPRRHPEVRRPRDRRRTRAPRARDRRNRVKRVLIGPKRDDR